MARVRRKSARAVLSGCAVLFASTVALGANARSVCAEASRANGDGPTIVPLTRDGFEVGRLLDASQHHGARFDELVSLCALRSGGGVTAPSARVTPRRL